VSPAGQGGAAAADDEALRERVRRAVRDALGSEASSLAPIAGGLGRRRFFRVRIGAGTAPTLVARVEQPEDDDRRPPGVPPEPALEPLRSFLERAGLPVPRRLGTACGVELLEDVGPLALASAVADADAASRRDLYREACALVPRLQALAARPQEVPAFGRRLDAALFAYKADFFVRWSLPRALGREATPAEAEAVASAFGLVSREAEAAPARLAHRDFTARNLHLRADRPAGQRVVMIDIQGAFLAPPEYDLVCLLRDSWVELPDEEAWWQREQVRPALPDAPDPDTFAWRFDLLTLTRKAKDHALGHYQAAMRGDAALLQQDAVAVRALRKASARLAGRDPRFAAVADLVARLPLEPTA